MEQGTSAYWRKLLRLDEPVAPGSLDRYVTVHRLLRPLLYGLTALPLRLYCPETVRGIERLPAGPPYILAANHGSALDYVTVAQALGKRRDELYPLVTKLFYDNPWALFWIKVAANAVRIDTVEDFFPALRTAVMILKAGQAVYVNPEGLRTLNGELLPFRPGVGVIAVETGVPLVPVYLHNTWKVLPTGSLFPRPYPLSVSFGEPLTMGGYQKKLANSPAYEVYKEVAEELRRRILALREVAGRSPA